MIIMKHCSELCLLITILCIVHWSLNWELYYAWTDFKKKGRKMFWIMVISPMSSNLWSLERAFLTSLNSFFMHYLNNSSMHPTATYNPWKKTVNTHIFLNITPDPPCFFLTYPYFRKVIQMVSNPDFNIPSWL